MIFWINVTGNSVKDFLATALTLHSLLTFAVSEKISIYFILFVIFLGLICSIIGTYGARIREQAKLIN